MVTYPGGLVNSYNEFIFILSLHEAQSWGVLVITCLLITQVITGRPLKIP